MAFFDNVDLSSPPNAGVDPTDPRVIRRLGMLGLGPGAPMQPPDVSPMPMPIDATPSSQALQRIYSAQPPSPTSQGLISAVQGGRNDWSDAPAPAVDPRAMMRRYGITDLTPPPAPQVNPAHGFWGKLGQHLLGAAEGMGSQRGLLPMLVGGIAGGVRPQLGANAWYNNVTMPRFQQQAGAQQQLNTGRFNQIRDVGAFTGIDATTGQPTYAAQQADVTQDARQAALDQKAAHDKEMADLKRESQQALLQKDLEHLDFKRQTLEDTLNRADLDRASREKIAQQHNETQQSIAELRRQIGELGGNRIEQTTYTDQPNAAYQQIQQKWYRQQQLNPDGSKPEWMSQSDYDLSFKEAQRQAEKEAKAGGIKATTRNETKQITKGGGQPASTASPAKVFPKSMLPKYMAAHPEYRTPEEAMKHIQDTGYTVQ